MSIRRRYAKYSGSLLILLTLPDGTRVPAAQARQLVGQGATAATAAAATKPETKPSPLDEFILGNGGGGSGAART